MSEPRPIETWLTDMDGVLVHEEDPIPGAVEFVEALKQSGRPFLVLTNNSIYTPRDLRARLLASGIDVPEDAIWTSALATAQFLLDQRPNGSAYVVGEAGLTTALHDIGYVMTERSPDYVVLGETRTYSFESITRAIRLIEGGARFIATNPDVSGPSIHGTLPATGSVAALISTATGRQPYYIGKPNPLMMRSALNQLEAHSESTIMIGDRMDTDIISGLEAGMRTILVTTGSTRPEDVERFPTVRPVSSTPSPTWSTWSPSAHRKPERQALSAGPSQRRTRPDLVRGGGGSFRILQERGEQPHQDLGETLELLVPDADLRPVDRDAPQDVRAHRDRHRRRDVATEDLGLAGLNSKPMLGSSGMVSDAEHDRLDRDVGRRAEGERCATMRSAKSASPAWAISPVPRRGSEEPGRPSGG